MSQDTCPICRESMNYDQHNSSMYRVHCPRCGEYFITTTELAVLKPNPLDSRISANISGFLQENKASIINLEQLKKLRTPSFHERADKILIALEKKTSFAGQNIDKDKSWMSLGWCANEKELDEIINYLESHTKRIIQLSAGSPVPSNKFKIAPDGWKHLETLKKINLDSQQGFVAMWFSEEMQQIYDDVIYPAIKDAGYKPHKIDRKEHNNKIDDEIIAEIRKSRFVLADFTGHRGGVYFETGYAKGLGLEVIWTCRDDEIKDLHFDTRQYNCIDWRNDNLEEFKKRITNRIISTIGQGTWKS